MSCKASVFLNKTLKYHYLLIMAGSYASYYAINHAEATTISGEGGRGVSGQAEGSQGEVQARKGQGRKQRLPPHPIPLLTPKSPTWATQNCASD